jgi:uncharacterized protein YecE (DUF72 family)
MISNIRIGCAGWSIDRQSASRFPGEGSHLQRYATVLNAAEINSSFYKPHQASTYARWAESVPDGFRFSVKLPRSISHYQKLADIDALLANFAAEAGALGDKLGCILVQLPPSLVLDLEVAEGFFERLHESFKCAFACEARHGSWFGDEATELLKRHRVTRVIADPPAGQAGVFVPTTDTIYARLHGSPRIYYSPYEEKYLNQVADYLKEHPGWCIFDNTASGAALPNALELMAKVG